jgi:hypothetical protein
MDALAQLKTRIPKKKVNEEFMRGFELTYHSSSHRASLKIPRVIEQRRGRSPRRPVNTRPNEAGDYHVFFDSL